MLLILFIALPIRGVVAACVIGSIASWLGFDSVHQADFLKELSEALAKAGVK